MDDRTELQQTLCRRECHQFGPWDNEQRICIHCGCTLTREQSPIVPIAHTNPYNIHYALVSELPTVPYTVQGPTSGSHSPFGKSMMAYKQWFVSTPNGGILQVRYHEDTKRWSISDLCGFDNSKSEEEVLTLAAKIAHAQKEGLQVSFTVWW